jgi:hypothetical protein
MEAMITYFGQPAKVACDGKCNKAWGINNRPENQLSEKDDDWEWLSDDELEDAPDDPGTSEGGVRKPLSNSEFPNKWCVRECERCVMSHPGEYRKPLQLRDFSNRIKNIIEP